MVTGLSISKGLPILQTCGIHKGGKGSGCGASSVSYMASILSVFLHFFGKLFLIIKKLKDLL